MRRLRRAFTLVEVLISAAIGATILGLAMYMYLQGNQMFYKTTEHTSFRGEAILVLEQVARDLEQLMVAPIKNPANNEWLLLQPYELLEPYDLEDVDPATGVSIPLPAGKGIRFYRSHHVEMDNSAGIPGGRPVMVGRVLEYRTVLADPSKPELGVNLLRNGKPINSFPLSEVVFHKEPKIVAASQLQASPSAILTVTVVPKGGVWGQMKKKVLDKLREDGALVCRTFHLTLYESMYTSKLYGAFEKMAAYKADQKVANPNPDLAITDPLENALWKDAYANSPPQLLDRIARGIGKGASVNYDIPGVFKLETTPFKDEDAYGDSWFAGAPVQPGAPVSAGLAGATGGAPGAGTPGAPTGGNPGSTSSQPGSGSSQTPGSGSSQ